MMTKVCYDIGVRNQNILVHMHLMVQVYEISFLSHPHMMSKTNLMRYVK